MRGMRRAWPTRSVPGNDRAFADPRARSRSAAAGSAVLLLATALALGQTRKEDLIQQILPRDAIPAIRNPRFVAADRARIAPDEKVLGLVVGKEARAYPLIDLDRHEVVDDTVGGTPIAASW